METSGEKEGKKKKRKETSGAAVDGTPQKRGKKSLNVSEISGSVTVECFASPARDGQLELPPPALTSTPMLTVTEEVEHLVVDTSVQRKRGRPRKYPPKQPIFKESPESDSAHVSRRGRTGRQDARGRTRNPVVIDADKIIFPKSAAEVLPYLRRIIPKVTEWEVIDYPAISFRGPNLFPVDVVNADLKKLLQRNLALECPYEGCHFRFSTHAGYKYHLLTCPLSKFQYFPPVAFVCQECGANLPSMQMAKYHYNTCHKPKPGSESTQSLNLSMAMKEDNSRSFYASGRPVRFSAGKALVSLKHTEVDEKEDQEDKEFVAGAEETQEAAEDEFEYDEMDAINENDDEEETEGKSRDEQSSTKLSESDDLLMTDDDQSSVRSNGAHDRFINLKIYRGSLSQRKEYMLSMLQKANKQYYAKSLSRPVAIELDPLWVWNDYIAIPDDLSSLLELLPPAKSSPKIMVENEPAAIELDLFESRLLGGDRFVLFCGGPVWAMDWRPRSPELPSDGEYLAVSALYRPSMHDDCIDKLASEFGLIQIWRLRAADASTPAAMEFLFGVVHRFDPVWTLKWFPGSEFQLARESVAIDDYHGLLLAACGDGRVRMLPVAEPSDVRSEFGARAILTAKTVWELRPPSFLAQSEHAQAAHGQCLSVDATNMSGRARIIAGFASGIVCLWDFTVKGEVLRQVNGPHIFYPNRVISCHTGAVRSLAWCRFAPNCFTTVSPEDQTFRVWDVSSRERVLAQLQGRRFTAVAWKRNTLGPVAVGETFKMHDVMSQFLLLHTYNNRLRRFSTVGGALTVDFSEDGHVLAAGNCQGAVVIQALNMNKCSLIGSKDDGRTMYKGYIGLRASVASSEAQTRSTTTGEGDAPQDDDGVGSSASNTEIFISSLKQGNKWDKDVMFEYGRHLPSAVHKVAFNPNASTFQWLAVGTQSGVVYLHQFKFPL